MTKPAGLNHHVLIIDNAKSAEAVRQSNRHLRKIIVPHVKVEFGEAALSADGIVAKWVSQDSGVFPVVESQQIQLSWADQNAAQKPHWHNHQIESYSSQFPIDLVFRPVDDISTGFQRVQVTGRVFIPARVCHFVKLSGLTEVLQFRTGGNADQIDLESDQILCSECFLSESCSEKLARETMEKPLGT